MDVATFLLMGACAFGGLAGWLFARRGMRRRLKRKGPVRQRAVRRWHLMLARGVPKLLPLVEFVLGFPWVSNFVQQTLQALRLKGVSFACERALASVMLASLICLVGIGGALLGSLPSALAVTAACCAGAFFCVRTSLDRYAARVRASIPDGIQAMKACFQAGLSLEQALEYLARHSVPEMGKAYERALRHLRLGCSASEALSLLRAEACAPEFRFVTVALDVQHQTGGSLTSILETAERAARDQFELERSLRVQTAQAQLSARVVSVMPFILLGVLSLITEGFLDAFFQSIAGVCLFFLALGMELAGIVLVRRILHVKGVTS